MRSHVILACGCCCAAGLQPCHGLVEAQWGEELWALVKGYH